MNLKTAKDFQINCLAWPLIALFILFYPELSWAHDPAKEPNPFGLILETKEGILIQAEDKGLATILHVVEEKSGIKINIAGHLNQDRLTVVVDQPDWPSAIRQLLSNYSIVELGGDPLLMVKVLDRVDSGGSHGIQSTQKRLEVSSQPQAISKGFVYRPVKRIRKKIWAKENIPYTSKELKIILEGKATSPLPEKLISNPAYTRLLAKYGVRKKEDLQNSSKALAIRSEAGKMLRVLQKRNAK